MLIRFNWNKKKNGGIKVFCFIICIIVGNFVIKIKLYVYI